ncbi:MAG TPA: glycosyltransferase family 4 protein [Actinomycetota bacterium]|nr:glycosyltransferase family 4 protein [Actinomycetota bacterium]
MSWESLHSISIGGVGVHVTELAAALDRKGHEVHVFTRMGNGQTQLDQIHGVWYHRCPFDLNADFVEEIVNMCRSIVHHVHSTEAYMGATFDVIHAHDWLAALAMAWIRQSGRKAILTMHSTEYGRCGNHFSGGDSDRIREIERYGTFCADRVIAVSHALKDELQWMYNLPDWKVETIYNGVSIDAYNGWIPDAGEIRQSYGIGPTDPTVLFAGRMAYQKGPDLLVEAIPMVLHHHPQTKFVFAGDGHMKGHCEARAYQLGAAHACTFLGQRGGIELTNLFKISDAVCVPSRNEPFGITVLEAWSAGKPVVASSSGGPGEFVWHEVTGLQVYPDPSSIAWGIGTLFTNFEWARWMGGNGRESVESVFNWDQVAEQVEALYSQ